MPSAYETRGLRKDGTTFEMDTHISMYESNGEVITVAHLRDISERKRAEEELYEKTRLSKILLDAFPCVALLLRPSTREIVVSNQAAVQVGAVPGTRCYSTWGQRETPCPWCLAPQVWAIGEAQHLEVEARGVIWDVHWIPVNNDLYMHFAIDITERKCAEESLRASTAKFEILVQVSPLAIFSIDMDENIQLWNAAAEKMFGWTASEVIGHPNPIVPTAKQGEYVAWSAHVLSGQALANQEAIRQRKDGWLVHVSLSSAPIHDADGKVAGRMAIIADITDQKLQQEQILATQTELKRLLAESDQSRRVLRSVVEDQREAEYALRQLNIELQHRVAERTAQLEAANKELEAFAYSVSHDLRSPLHAIDGYSRILLEDYTDKLDAEGNRLFSVVRANAQKMDQLITDLLMLSRTTRGEIKMEQVDMAGLTNTVYHEIASLEVQTHVTLSLEALPPTHGDLNLLRQVWTNLISNAIKFTQTKTERHIQIGGYKQDDRHVYYVKDNGVGFNPDYTNKLFGVFQRLHKAEEFPGTGVGLAIIQRIVHRHGGEVWAEGQLGQGATFYFSISC